MIKEILKNPQVRWLNIFLRDVFLVAVMIYVNYITHFRSWWGGFIIGMLFVWISWQLTDYLKWIRSKNGLQI